MVVYILIVAKQITEKTDFTRKTLHETIRVIAVDAAALFLNLRVTQSLRKHKSSCFVLHRNFSVPFSISLRAIVLFS
jgi:hypothetical protein